MQKIVGHKSLKVRKVLDQRMVRPVPSNVDLDALRVGTSNFVSVVNLEVNVPNVPDAAKASAPLLKAPKTRLLSYSDYKVQKALEEQWRLELEQKRMDQQQAEALAAQLRIDKKMKALKKLKMKAD